MKTRSQAAPQLRLWRSGRRPLRFTRAGQMWSISFWARSEEAQRGREATRGVSSELLESELPTIGFFSSPRCGESSNRKAEARAEG